MAKGAYVGVDGVAHKIKGGYVGVGGVARKIKKAYIGIGGVARPCWNDGPSYYGTITPLDTASRPIGASVGDYALFSTARTSYRYNLNVYNSSYTHSTISSGNYTHAGGSFTTASSHAVLSGGDCSVVSAWDSSLTRTQGSMSTGRAGHTSGCVGQYTFVCGGYYLSGGFIYSSEAYDASLTLFYGPMSTYGVGIATAKMGDRTLFGGAIQDADSTFVNGNAYAIDSSLTSTYITTLYANGEDGCYFTGANVGDCAVFGGGRDVDKWINVDGAIAIKNGTVISDTIPLTSPRTDMGAASMPERILFAGGSTTVLNSNDITTYRTSAVVESIDASLTVEQLDSLSVARGDIGTAVVGKNAFFAGGIRAYNGAGSAPDSNVVEVYKC